MPLRHDVPPEPLNVDESYGLGDLGENHRSLDDVYAKIATARNWWVNTVAASGRPHSVPVWGLITGDRMLFCSGEASAKTQNLLANPSVNVHLESGDDVVIVEASTALVPAAELPASFADDYEAKYDFRPDPSEAGFTTHEVLPTKILSWTEADFAATAVRWRFGQA